MKNKSVGNLENNSNLIQGKKRGRKSKKEIEEAKKIIECNEQPVLNKITNDNIIVNIEDNLNIIFLKGGILADYGACVAAPGDIIQSSVIKQLTEVFTKVDPETLIIIVKSNG